MDIRNSSPSAIIYEFTKGLLSNENPYSRLPSSRLPISESISHSVNSLSKFWVSVSFSILGMKGAFTSFL